MNVDFVQLKEAFVNLIAANLTRPFPTSIPKIYLLGKEEPVEDWRIAIALFKAVSILYQKRNKRTRARVMGYEGSQMMLLRGLDHGPGTDDLKGVMRD